MKNLIHHTVVVTCRNENLIKNIRKKMMELIAANTSVKNATMIVSEPMKSITSEFYTLVVSPDGSKEGYDISYELDNARNDIVGYLKALSFEEKEESLFAFVEMKYGDGMNPEIVNYG